MGHSRKSTSSCPHFPVYIAFGSSLPLNNEKCCQPWCSSSAGTLITLGAFIFKIFGTKKVFRSEKRLSSPSGFPTRAEETVGSPSHYIYECLLSCSTLASLESSKPGATTCRICLDRTLVSPLLEACSNLSRC